MPTYKQKLTYLVRLMGGQLTVDSREDQGRPMRVLPDGFLDRNGQSLKVSLNGNELRLLGLQSTLHFGHATHQADMRRHARQLNF